MWAWINRSSAIALVFLSFAGAAPRGFNDALAQGHGPHRGAEAQRRHGGATERWAEPRRAVADVDGTRPYQAAGKRPLDLTLPRETLRPVDPSLEEPGGLLYRGLPGLEDTRNGLDPLTTMRRALPGLLDPQNDDSPVTIRGRLLMDRAVEPSPEAVDGGQIIIEVKTE